MTPQQRFLLLLILVGALATVLGLVSKRTRMLPYPVVLAAAGVVIGVLPGGQFPLLSLLVQGTLIAPVMRGLRLESTA
ncbi:MAG: hypothetical protein WCC30_02100 [Candidatus Dormiibacterota bacterium]